MSQPVSFGSSQMASAPSWFSVEVWSRNSVFLVRCSSHTSPVSLRTLPGLLAGHIPPMSLGDEQKEHLRGIPCS